MHTALLATFLMLSTQGYAKKPKPPAPPPPPAAPVQPAPPAAPPPVAAPAEPDGRWARCPRDVNRSFGELERTLRDLGESVDAVSDRRERRRLRDDLDHTIRLTERARDAACDAANAAPPPPTVIVAPPPPPPPPPPQPVVLSAAAFAELKAAVERESFDDGKARVIGLAIRGDTCVTVDQTRQLVALHSFSDAQLNTVKALAPRFVDPERAFTLQEALTFPTDRERLAKVLKSANQIPACRVP
jgi:hypothetical protein